MNLLHGKNFIGSELSSEGISSYTATNPANGADLPGEFFNASETEIQKACFLAEKAFDIYKNISGVEKAVFLRQIADNLMELGEDLVQRCCDETGLPEARILGERGRTCGQLNLFANLIEEGSWVQASIDTALPEREPLPKPDLRSMQRALGPVAVFGASNFPLAFSTAGGDTASALAAGCPVVVKAHPAHPGVSEMVAGAIVKAVLSCGMPEGTFSMIHSESTKGGQMLVTHPVIRAVGFTGSFAGGKAIYQAATQRPEPIPVYAEMGSSNPVVILPETMKNNSDTISAGLVNSVCLGAGQFCTNPGMVMVMETESTDAFIENLKNKISECPAGTTVHASIKTGYDCSLKKKLEHEAVSLLAQSSANTMQQDTEVQPALCHTTAKTLMTHPELQEEVFGPCTLLVTCVDKQELMDVLNALEGQLTLSIFGEEQELQTYRDLCFKAETIAGRLIVNQFPTGVEVCPSMIHGGPFPATTDSRSTSVGTQSIYRFARPVCYQNMPQSLLPQELQDDNPLGIKRLKNGEMNLL